MKNEFHIASSVISLVVALLEYFLVGDIQLANSIITMAVSVNSFLHLISEYRFYRQNNAVIASSQFTLIPLLNILLINILGPKSASAPILHASAGIDVLSTETSLFGIPFLILITFLMGRYYQKRYTGFVVRRKIYSPLKLPLFIHSVAIAFLITSTILFGYLDVIGLSAIVIYLVQIISYLVIPRLRSPGYDNSARRRYMNRLTNQTSRSPSSRSDYSPPTERRVIPRSPSQRLDRPSRRRISTSPNAGYRAIPVESRNRTGRLDHKKSSKQKIAQLSDGIDMLSKPKQLSKGNNINFLPNGNAKKEDLKCMICYQAFDKTSKGIVSLCPNCKYPAHEEELNQWLIQSSKCPRCSKEITNRVNSKLRLNEREYVKIIKNV